MIRLAPIGKIKIPAPLPDETYSITLGNRHFSFQGLKALLGASDFSKAGDRGAGLTASDELEREAARTILSSLSLQHLYDHPLVDDRGLVDSVMRVNYDIDENSFERYSKWSVGEVKDHLMKTPGDEIKKIGGALTGVMVAALAKIMDTHELIYVSRKISCPTRARTTLGLPGTLSSRLQPNHPVDDIRGVTLLTYIGLSMGSGDALIGINPAVDTVENVSALLHHLDQIRRKTGAPTQICVLSHIKTQLACLEKGAPVEILFQSLAGTEATNLKEFDISVELLDLAYQTMAERGPLRDSARQFMYFETGQGSEFTYGKHHGMDMTTAEALCYGLARRYDPFMVNNVTGFIGPETHLDNFEMIISNLQDHFMGKLLGLPMGMAPCFTLHSKITLEGQQMATQMLTAAGANYFMDVHLNTDRMLAYFDTSGHDNQTLREIHGKVPTPEFLEWAIDQNIYRRDESGVIHRGHEWGNPRRFCSSEFELQELIKATPAIHGFSHAGPRPTHDVTRKVRTGHAAGRAATYLELDIEVLQKIRPFRVVSTEASDKEAHLNSPILGAQLSKAARVELPPEQNAVQIIVSDGLSAEAIHANLAELFPVIEDGLIGKRISYGQPVAVRYGRVKIAEQIAQCLATPLTLLLIGERPGGDATACTSLSAYLIFQLLNPIDQAEAARFSGNTDIRFEYTVVSNIYSSGLPPIEAGSLIVEKISTILTARAAGNRLESYLKEGLVHD